MRHLVFHAFLLAGCRPVEPILELHEEVYLAQLSWEDFKAEDPTNAFFEEEAAQVFGRELFYDARLSRNATQSCGSCHVPELGFADGLLLAEGAGVAARHTPSLLSVARQDWYLWDGGCDSLWCQAVGPMENPSEMDFSRGELAHLIHGDEDYKKAYEDLFGSMPPIDDDTRFPVLARPNWSDEESLDHLNWMSMLPSDREAVNRVLTNVSKALGAFQGRIERVASPFDSFAQAVREDDLETQDLYSDQALEGYKLFVGRAGCVRCHSGSLFSSGAFVNAGVGDRDWLTEPDEGRIEGVLDVLENPFNAAGAFSDDPLGKRAQELLDLSPEPEMLGSFKVPTLRNVALSPPYMHGGQLASLKEVLEHYSTLEENPREGETDARLQPLNLTPEESRQLVAFLESLTGEHLDPWVLPPEGWAP